MNENLRRKNMKNQTKGVIYAPRTKNEGNASEMLPFKKFVRTEIVVKDMRINVNSHGVILTLFNKNGEFLSSAELVNKYNMSKSSVVLSKLYDRILYQYANLCQCSHNDITRHQYEVIPTIGPEFRFYEYGLVQLLDILAPFCNKGQFTPSNYMITGINISSSKIPFIKHISITTVGGNIIERDITTNDAKTIRYIISKLKDSKSILFELSSKDIVRLNSYDVMNVLLNIPDQHGVNYFEFIRDIIPSFKYLLITNEVLSNLIV